MHTLNMVICHSSEPVKSWKLSARKRRLVTRLSASHENRSPKAQLGQRLTEKPGQYWLGFESPMVHGIFLPVSLQCRLSYGIRTAPVWFVSQSPFNADSLTVFAQPPCAIACINICVHVKKHKHWQPYTTVWTPQYCTHWQQWVALLLPLLCLLCLTQVRRPELPTRDDEVIHTLTNNSPRKAATEIVVFLWICQFDI